MDKYNKADYNQKDYLDLVKKLEYIETKYNLKNKIGLDLKQKGDFHGTIQQK